MPDSKDPKDPKDDKASAAAAPATPSANVTPKAEATATGGGSATATTGNEPPATSTSTSGGIGGAISQLGTTLLKAAVYATRNVVVPLAEVYAPGAEQSIREGGVFTVAERQVLARAGRKLLCEVGEILVANYPITAAGKPDCCEPPPQKSVVEEQRIIAPAETVAARRYQEPSIAYLFSAVRAGQAYLQRRADEKLEQARVAAAKELAAKRAPVPVSALRNWQK